MQLTHVFVDFDNTLFNLEKAKENYRTKHLENDSKVNLNSSVLEDPEFYVQNNFSITMDSSVYLVLLNLYILTDVHFHFLCHYENEATRNAKYRYFELLTNAIKEDSLLRWKKDQIPIPSLKIKYNLIFLRNKNEEVQFFEDIRELLDLGMHCQFIENLPERLDIIKNTIDTKNDKNVVIGVVNNNDNMSVVEEMKINNYDVRDLRKLSDYFKEFTE